MMAHQKWQYLTVVRPTDEELQLLGEDGWELVAVIYDPAERIGPVKGAKVLYFKRPLADDVSIAVR